MNTALRSGLTIIELLVVVSIIAMLSSMVLVIPDNEDPDQLVVQAATELESTLKEARKLAIEWNKAIAVVFHIENSGDSRVYKNYSHIYNGPEVSGGRHWYGIVGPDFNNGKSFSEPPNPGTYPNLEELKRSVELSLVGGKRYLPKGTRFLALGDSDWGNVSTERGYPDGNKGDTHPRPWFGYFKDGTLYPWGGYNPEQDEVFRNSSSYIKKSCTTGMLYEGCDGEIPYNATLDCNVSPSKVHGLLYDSVTGTATKRYHDYGGTADTGQDPALTSVGKPRAIFNGLAMEFVIIFMDDGSCKMYKNARKKFYEPVWHTHRYRNPYGLKQESSKTGGFHFTIARDIDPDDEIYDVDNPVTKQKDYTKFKDENDAFSSIWPFRRVFLQMDTGDSCVRDPYHPDSFLEPEHLLQKSPYPPKNIPDY